MAAYVWPLGNSVAPDEMNTSFGPRINENRWDFHDGIDLPAPVGTRVHAMHAGRVHRAGEGGRHKFSSRHVVIKTREPGYGPMYHLYLHLDSIEPAISQGAEVAQGQQIGTVGEDDATYPHLHMGYQKSDMLGQGRADLAYGILVRAIPPRCDGLVARVVDVRGNVATSALICIPQQEVVDEFLDFEDGQVPPCDWRALTSRSGVGTSIAADASAAHSGSMGLLCIDSSATEASTQRAALQYDLPGGRFEWRVEAWFNPAEIALEPGKFIHLLEFGDSSGRIVAAHINHSERGLRAGLNARSADRQIIRRDASAALPAGRWRKWRLELLRLATRETTAILFLNNGGRMQEQVRLNWDSVGREPIQLRAGIARSSSGATTTLFLDELWLTETEMPM